MKWIWLWYKLIFTCISWSFLYTTASSHMTPRPYTFFLLPANQQSCQANLSKSHLVHGAMDHRQDLSKQMMRFLRRCNNACIASGKLSAAIFLVPQQGHRLVWICCIEMSRERERESAGSSSLTDQRSKHERYTDAEISDEPISSPPSRLDLFQFQRETITKNIWSWFHSGKSQRIPEPDFRISGAWASHNARKSRVSTPRGSAEKSSGVSTPKISSASQFAQRINKCQMQLPHSLRKKKVSRWFQDSLDDRRFIKQADSSAWRSCAGY